MTSIYIEVMEDNEPRGYVSIRKMTDTIHAYEISPNGDKPSRGTITSDTASPFGLIAECLQDWNPKTL